MPTEELTQKNDEPEMIFEHVGMDRFDDVFMIIQECSQWLVDAKEMYHWDKYYKKDIVEGKILNGMTYILEVDGESAATGTLNVVEGEIESYKGCYEDPNYDESLKTLQLGAFGVRPKFQGKRLGVKFMEFVEQQAVELEVDRIVFDARSSYSELIKFYGDRGYKQIGKIYDEVDEDYYFIMEKVMKEV